MGLDIMYDMTVFVCLCVCLRTEFRSVLVEYRALLFEYRALLIGLYCSDIMYDVTRVCVFVYG